LSRAGVVAAYDIKTAMIDVADAEACDCEQLSMSLVRESINNCPFKHV